MDKHNVRAAVERIAPATDSLYYGRGEISDAYWQRVANAPEYGWIVDEIRAEGARLLNELPPELTDELFSIYARTGSRLEYERAYFERRRRLNTFMLLSLLEPEEEINRNNLHETIRVMLDEPTWCLPAHVKGRDIGKTIDLFSAETGFALSEIACVLGDRLPSSLVEEIDNAVSKRLILPFLQHGPHNWETARHNWSAVCAGSIGSAALLRVSDTDVLSEVLGKALTSLEYYLEGFGEDGACPEGLGYWNYGFGYYVYFADLLKKLTRGELDLLRKPKVRSIAMFQQAAYLHGDAVACFSDSLPRIPFHGGLTHYLAGEYSEMEVPALRYAAGFADDHCSGWAPAFRDLIWFDPTKAGAEWGSASRYLPDAEWLVSRHVTASGRRFGFAAKGGNNDEPHNHNDIGQFMLIADGTTVAADLGSGEYTAAYFGEGRYDYDCNGSQGHSVPIVDGCMQAAGADSFATVLEAMTGEREDLLRLEMSRAYPMSGLKSLVRELRWSKTDDVPTLTLTDEFVFSGQSRDIVERIVTLHPPVLAGNGVVRLYREGDDSEPAALLRYDDSRLDASIEQRSYRDHFGLEKAWYAIDFIWRSPELYNRIELLFEF
ncbi:hypothetical protein E2980_11075 [Cohnella luojiensis]|uniref:Heparinase n=1 Tax=Cohnella luojiensis TaxID=652876 RepID=A0A4Y8LYY5_9BACL|nr:heparinase II/III family protein [Cohnella luojiensis]TFE26652.1 hypothetical protein E2980_11075 [Cohnella luojiensis]